MQQDDATVWEHKDIIIILLLSLETKTHNSISILSTFEFNKLLGTIKEHLNCEMTKYYRRVRPKRVSLILHRVI